ncbi:Riboflavin transporter MCH5 [Penicillium rolfsii]|nr:Riboflavin transporter MCH5 [Penicillium rolfsii]
MPQPTDKATPTESLESDLPAEESVQGWTCVSGSFLALFCTFGFLNAIGVFQTKYQKETLKSFTPSSISWIFAVQICLMWALGPLYGRILDTYGPAPVLYPCSILCILSLCMTSIAHQYYQIFLAQGLGFGIGAGGVFTSAMVCVGQWFSRRRGLAIGISSCGASVGGVVFPVFLQSVIKVAGFDAAVRWTALMVGVFLGAACWLIKARLPGKRWDRETKWFDTGLFGERQFAWYTFGAYFVMWGLWGPFDFLSSMAEAKGFSSTLSLYLISILNASSIFGRIIPPYLADHIGHFNVLTACAMLTGGSMLILWLPLNYHPSHAGIIAFALVYGFVSGAVVSLLMPCVAKTGSLDTLGQRFGTFQMVISVSCLTGLPIMGGILNRQSATETDFSGLQLFSSITTLLGAGGLMVSTYLLSRSHGTWKV